MHVVRHVLRQASGSPSPAHRGCCLRRRHAGPPGPLEAQRRLERGCRLEGLRILALEGRGFSPDEQRFHDALLKFVKVIDRLQIELTAEDVKIILSDDEVQIYYPGRSRVRDGVSAADWRSSRTGGGTS